MFRRASFYFSTGSRLTGARLPRFDEVLFTFICRGLASFLLAGLAKIDRYVDQKGKHGTNNHCRKMSCGMYVVASGDNLTVLLSQEEEW